MNSKFSTEVYACVLIFTLFIETHGHHATIYETKKRSIELSWKVDYQRQRLDCILKVTCRFQSDCPASFGIGISDRGKVVNADFLMVQYDEEKVEIQDSWSDGEGWIYPDDHQDYILDEYVVGRNYVTVGFWRFFDTGDRKDYRLDNGTTNLIYVLAENIDEGSGQTLTSRVFKGMGDFVIFASSGPNAFEMEHGLYRLQLLKPDLPLLYFGLEDTKSSKTFSIVQPNITILARTTTYWCSVHEIPAEITHKIHGIGFEAQISQKTRNLVHHMEVFMCDVNDKPVSPYSGPCGASTEPPDVRRCNKVKAAWAKGADAFFYPEIAGIPFGGRKQSRYLRLEIHYHNPLRIRGLVDNSGIRFFYSEELRKFDAGILEVGVTYTRDVAIPPGQTNFVLPGFCPKSCTSEGIPPGGIRVFGSQLHTHLAGTGVWTSHLRNGGELPEINRDDHYSTWFEEIRHIYPEATILPGDSMVTACSYNTANRKAPTLGGLGIFEEMCVNYLHYYPLASLEVCKSSPSFTSLAEYFLLEKLLTGYPDILDFERISSNYQHMKWNANTSDALELLYSEADIAVECRRHNGDQFPGKWNELSIS